MPAVGIWNVQTIPLLLSRKLLLHTYTFQTQMDMVELSKTRSSISSGCSENQFLIGQCHVLCLQETHETNQCARVVHKLNCTGLCTCSNCCNGVVESDSDDLESGSDRDHSDGDIQNDRTRFTYFCIKFFQEERLFWYFPLNILFLFVIQIRRRYKRWLIKFRMVVTSQSIIIVLFSDI